MARATRRGYGEDGIYFDHRADCHDSAHHRTCSGRWREVVSLGFDAYGPPVAGVLVVLAWLIKPGPGRLVPGVRLERDGTSWTATLM